MHISAPSPALDDSATVPSLTPPKTDDILRNRRRDGFPEGPASNQSRSDSSCARVFAAVDSDALAAMTEATLRRKAPAEHIVMRTANQQ